MMALLLTLAGFGALGILCFVCYHAGKSDEKAAGFEEDKTSVEKAAAVRDRLVHDTAYAERLRGRFTR